MKVKFSGIGVVDGRGKLNGTVFSRNRSGAIARVKVTPINPNTASQAQARSILTSLSQSWRTFNQSVILVWNAAVADFQTTDVFGDLRTPTGKNLFTKLNANLISVGVSPITTAPLPSDVSDVTLGAVTISVGTPTYELAFAGDDAAVNYQIWATPGLSPGISFVSSEYRQIGAVAGGGGSPYNFAADYLAKYGAPATGSKVFCKMVPVNNTTGQKGIASSASTLVIA